MNLDVFEAASLALSLHLSNTLLIESTYFYRNSLWVEDNLRLIVGVSGLILCSVDVQFLLESIFSATQSQKYFLTNPCRQLSYKSQK